MLLLERHEEWRASVRRIFIGPCRLSELGPCSTRPAALLGEDAHVLLQRGDEVRHELHRHHDVRAHGRPHDVLGLRLCGSLSDSGITSQKVSVKSNGVCAIAQKFA